MKYVQLCNTPSDIHEHLPTLQKYASECDHITEMGVRYVVSTFALLQGKPKVLVSVDIQHPRDVRGGHLNRISGAEELEQAERLARENGVSFRFIQANSLEMDIDETDLLFLDTLHQYNQLRQELERHHKNVRKYIILHDTTSFAYRDEGDDDEGQDAPKGLYHALRLFIETHGAEWKIQEVFTNNNGLTVLKRI